VNAFLIACTLLLGLLVLPGYVLLRARPIDAVVALELCGTVTTLALLCLAEGFHRSTYFSLALVTAAMTWVGGLIFARFFGRVL
jgi:multisubunit Na+/H+ antiporter MnhF subunit